MTPVLPTAPFLHQVVGFWSSEPQGSHGLPLGGPCEPCSCLGNCARVHGAGRAGPWFSSVYERTPRSSVYGEGRSPESLRRPFAVCTNPGSFLRTCSVQFLFPAPPRHACPDPSPWGRREAPLPSTAPVTLVRTFLVTSWLLCPPPGTGLWKTQPMACPLFLSACI